MDNAGERYKILDDIRAGGMATVKRAYDSHMGREVALKLMRKDSFDGELLKELEREASLIAGLRHRNIVTVHDWGYGRFGLELPCYDEDLGGTFSNEELADCLYIVEEKIDGFPLSVPLSALKESSGAKKLWPRRTLLKYAGEALEGLECVHANGIVHRDIKPSNIMIEPDSASVKIIDFGIAKRCGYAGGEAAASSRPRNRRPDETMTGTIKGTALYASPEQARGDRAIDHRSDIYSMGVVLYEVATLRHPIEGEDCFAIIRRKTKERPVTPRERLAGLPRSERLVEPEEISDGLESIVMRCLEARPEDRYHSAGELQADLRSYLSREEPLGAVKRWRAGEVIVKEGELGQELYYLRAGKVVAEAGGRTLQELSSGRWLGFAALAGMPRTATVRATEDCEAYVFSGMTDEKDLFMAVRDDPAMAVSLIKELASLYSKEVGDKTRHLRVSS